MRLRKRSGALDLLTSEVSFRDVFVRTTDTPPENSLVRLDFTLPPDDAIISISACVEALVVASPDGEHYPGFLARLVGLDGPPKKRWEQLVMALREHYPEAKDTTVRFARRSYFDRFTRRGSLSLSLPYEPATVEALRTAVDELIAHQALHVPTPQAIILGAPVTIELAHPITGECIPLPGVVKRRLLDKATAAVRVRIEPLSEEDARALREFVDSVVVDEEYDVDVHSEPVLHDSDSD